MMVLSGFNEFLLPVAPLSTKQTHKSLPLDFSDTVFYQDNQPTTFSVCLFLREYFTYVYLLCFRAIKVE